LDPLWPLQSGVKKVHDYDMEEGGGRPAPPAFAPDESGFHPLSGPSKRLDPSAVLPLEKEPPISKTSSPGHPRPFVATPVSAELAGFGNPVVVPGSFSPLSNSLKLQGNHPTRRFGGEGMGPPAQLLHLQGTHRR